MSSFKFGKRTPDSHSSYAQSQASIARPAALPASAHHHDLRRCGVGLLISLLVALAGALPLALGGCDDDPAPVTSGPPTPVTFGPTVSLTLSTTTAAAGDSSKVTVPKVTVPEVVHLYVDEAEDLLAPLGLTCEVVHENWASGGSSDDYCIYEQDPAPGTRVARGSSVEVSIRRFGLTMPRLVGMTKTAALETMDLFPFVTVNVVYVLTPQASEVGIVLTQDPAGGTPFVYFDGPVTIGVGKLMSVEPTFPSVSIPHVSIPPLGPFIPNP